ncbi:TetR/AcrR family transcriptional regulator [Actinoplanes derwentensis]|uniref:Regulatory protein, tetR family n=1 Tax=Actinoplanes derwentensis TaxID=113562 RepID=A0A1H1SGV6_9ACTN|nr:helix-turn-helix domain-containing protein [Actinoplanes derwentensis]GID83311.1 TetR family transcriptional regulator [Actinoplanes derwentensis]SDS46946.1 regulatory protein, tetR family [Actinoplanes derwentensis]
MADGRQRFLEAAVRLFARHSVAGTSLQMIGDELGVTKAAVHHHFRSREELLTAVVEPVRVGLRSTVAAAEALRGRHVRADRALTGFVDLVLANRELLPVLQGDPGAAELLGSHPDLHDLTGRLTQLLADVEPGPTGHVRADAVLSGTACAAGPRSNHIDPAELRAVLIETGRRALALRIRKEQPRTSQLC